MDDVHTTIIKRKQNTKQAIVMKTYREFIGEVLNGKEYREKIEWTNTWIDNAPPPECQETIDSQQRLLIIGDSTARMVRSTLARVLKCPIDLVATSANIYDEMFVNLVDTFFNNNLYQYNIIFVQLGQHGRIGVDGGEFTDSDLARYKGNMISLLNFLKQYCSCIIVETIYDAVLIPTTKLQKWLIKLHIKKEVKDANINAVTQAKNGVLPSVCRDTNCFYLDINSFMNSQRYIHVDHIHFEQNAKTVIAQRMIEEIERVNRKY